MGVSQFLPFAAQSGANVVSQATFASDPATGVGFSAGIALSAKLNKVWRQSSFISAGITELMLRYLDQDVLDNGDLAAFTDQLDKALIAMRPVQALIEPVTNYYVSVSRGSDFADGRTSATAWQTLQHAATWIPQHIDFNLNQIIVNVEDGTYAPFEVKIPPINSGGFLFLGNVANPNACVIAAQNNSCVIGSGVFFQIQGFNLRASGTGPWEGCGLVSRYGGRINYMSINFGACDFVQVFAGYGGFCQPDGSYSISGNATHHFRASGAGTGGRGALPTPMTISIIGNITFAGSFMSLDGLSYVFFDPNFIVFAGAGNVTGKKHLVFSNSICQIPNGDINYFPGQLSGSVPPQANVPTAGGSGGIFMTAFPGVSREADYITRLNEMR